MQTYSNQTKRNMEDNIHVFENERRPQFFENRRRHQFFENGRQPQSFL